MIKTTATATPQQQQQLTDSNKHDVQPSPAKMERRNSNTSESSLEHLDLGRTPKKLNIPTSATSTPRIYSTSISSSGDRGGSANGNQNTSVLTKLTTGTGAATVANADRAIGEKTFNEICKKPKTNRHTQNQDSDEANECDDDDDDDEDSSEEKHRGGNISASRSHRHHHHKRRSSGRSLDKRSVQLELNSDNPNSLRKKFRFNRSVTNDTVQPTERTNNNESGFIDASSSSSQFLNASATSLTAMHTKKQSHHQSPENCATGCQSSSSASSSPHGAGASGSSPESGLGERDDMKFVCPICEVVSATPHEFTNHIRCHNYSSGDTENFTCRICSKVLSSASSLDRHVLVHTGERPFNCKYCHLTFTTNGNMHRHMRTHKQHQHNHHHRRNSNGTASKHATNSNNNHNNNNNNNNNNSHNRNTVVGGAAQSDVASAAAAPAAHLTNGTANNERSTKATVEMPPTSETTPNPAAAQTTINGYDAKRRTRLNGGIKEIYDSDGGCSTDSSSGISHDSIKVAHNDNNKINNNNNNNKNSNNNDSLINMKANGYSKDYNNSCKRKNIDILDMDLSYLKRRAKINNLLNSGKENPTDNHPSLIPTSSESNEVDRQTPTEALRQQTHHLFTCPVCNAADFDSLLDLSKHMDNEHCDIPAKCRHCDVIFRTHRQLNVHPCTMANTQPRMKIFARDREFVDEFSNENSPHIPTATVQTPKFTCSKCGCGFDSDNDRDAHMHECHTSQIVQRPLANTEHDIETEVLERSLENQPLSEFAPSTEDAKAEEKNDEEHRCEEFFKRLYLKSKTANAQQRQSSESSHHSVDDDPLDDLKFEADCERVAQQSHDSKDLADIQSILNMTSSSSTSNFLKNFENSVNTPSSNYGLDKDEEEAQDVFTSEFRKMKLRGEFPCKLCIAVFPNLRALKGHNRVHLSAAGPSGPFRCNMCPYSICDKAALVRHMRTHNGDRPYECAVCNYAFTTKANCERHLRNRHAKTTRDDVKRAIIYHPSEDSTCDDPTKKLHLFSSPEVDEDVELQYQHHQPNDRSTPVSHLKDMLTGDDGRSHKAVKIQVKSLEQLLDKANVTSAFNESFEEHEQQPPDSDQSPIDLSMDVLDLSKKPAKSSLETPPNALETPQSNAILAAAINDNDNDPKSEMHIPDKNQQYLLAQQHLINDAFPKIVDPAHYFQQLYRNLVFPPINPINPFFLHNSFLPNNLGDLQKYAPLMNRMFTESHAMITDPKTITSDPNLMMPSSIPPQPSPLLSDKSSVSSVASSSPVNTTNAMHNKPIAPSTPPQAINIHRHQNIQSTTLSGGPVKMVIKNGVLMPKQKQRRYRTERPFACEHCSARFTLRSNMERHVKQQHPQFYAQRQRSGHHILRGRGGSNTTAINSITHLQAAISAHSGSSSGHVASASISDQVKYAILAQQLKARKDTDLLHQALAHGSSSITSAHSPLASAANLSRPANSDVQLNFNSLNNNGINNGAPEEEDDPKLVIDEDDDDDDDDDIEEIVDDNEEDLEVALECQGEAINLKSRSNNRHQSEINDDLLQQIVNKKKPNESAKKVAETILEQAIKAGSTGLNSQSNSGKPNVANSQKSVTTMKTMIAQAESVGKFLKEVASSSFKDESQDLVPVAKLVDNATTNSMSFNNYFRPSDVVNQMEQSDEEGLVASGSASESNNSGTEDISSAAEPKKKSAYSLAPNRVSCPYCQRMFPWSSSLRRHILTHTGQKPFKCSHCPLLFTTKSNCDRHLLRKHGNVESAVSVYVPTEDVNEPIPVPKSVEEIEQQQRQRQEEERKRKAEEHARLEREQRNQRNQREQLEQLQQEQQQQHQQQQQLLKQLASAQFKQSSQSQITSASMKLESNSAPFAAASAGAGGAASAGSASANAVYSELPFKCHLCDCSFAERIQCLDHIKIQHTQEFSLLLTKGALETDPEHNQGNSAEDEEYRRPPPGSEENTARNGKYPDYSNRKVICAFCVRRFWSTEDLRRHMRTHSGERPFQCDICLRKFTLKHSMLRHMKKHSGRHDSSIASCELSNAGNSCSDLSDDEQMPPATQTPNAIMMANTLAMRTHKIQELLSKASEWGRSLGEHKENIADDHQHHQNHTDLIGNLLGISDQGILNKLLSSADEAAKLLGVDK